MNRNSANYGDKTLHQLFPSTKVYRYSQKQERSTFTNTHSPEDFVSKSLRGLSYTICKKDCTSPAENVTHERQ